MLSFNVGTENSCGKTQKLFPRRRSEAICELLKREQPDVIILQECSWTGKKSGKVLRPLLAAAAVPGRSREWVIEEQLEIEGIYNTIIYDGSLFTAKAYKFEDLGIDLPESSHSTRSAEHFWVERRYLLLHLVSKAKKLQFYVCSWHARWTGMKHGDHAGSARCLLLSAALLAKKVSRFCISVRSMLRLRHTL